jgi:hypothetical protein
VSANSIKRDVSKDEKPSSAHPSSTTTNTTTNTTTTTNDHSVYNQNLVSTPCSVSTPMSGVTIDSPISAMSSIDPFIRKKLIHLIAPKPIPLPELMSHMDLHEPEKRRQITDFLLSIARYVALNLM